MTENTENGIRNDHSLISPTAKLVAYGRGFSDIPYSKDISNIIHAEEASRDFLKVSQEDFELTKNVLAPFTEARFKAQDRYLSGKNTLELAVGILPRGILANPAITYVGTDLPGMINETKTVMNEIMKKYNLYRPNLHFEAANALNYPELKDASRHFSGYKFNVGFEGLFQYLNRDEQASMLCNLRKLITPGKGIIVTPDINDIESRTKSKNLRSEEFNQKASKILQKMNDGTKRNIIDSYFPTHEDALKFIRDCGFSARDEPIWNGEYSLSSTKDLPPKFREDILNFTKSMKLWVLTPR